MTRELKRRQDRGIPDPEIRALITASRRGSPADSAELNGALSPRDASALHLYARGTAVRSVREKRPSLFDFAYRWESLA